MDTNKASEEKIQDMYFNDRLSIRQISRQLCVSAWAVQLVLKHSGRALRTSKEGAVLQGHTKPVVDREKIPEMYRQGMTEREIAKAVGLTGGAVHSILKVRGVEFRHQTDSKRIKLARKHAEYKEKREAARAADVASKQEQAQAKGWSAVAQLNDGAWLRQQATLLSAYQIAAQLGCSERSVRNAFTHYGITRADATPAPVDRLAILAEHRLHGGDINASFGMLGRTQSAYQRLRAREVNLGKKRSKGRKHTPEAIEKMKRVAIGKKGTNLGRKFSEEHKAKLRASNLGQKRSEETKAKIRAARAEQVLPITDTVPEQLLQAALTAKGIEFEVHVQLRGTPDIFIRPNICVFVDGDYWHNRPETKRRDICTNRVLRKKGFVVVRFWEREIKASTERCVQQLLQKIAVRD